MNADKAKEHFSAYFEGTLDRGLRQSFERRLESDADVQSEYRAFEKTMKELEQLSAPVPEPAFDLHERISARLDRHIIESRSKPSGSLLGRWRMAVVAGVCVLAIVGAGLQIGSRAGEGSFPSRLFPWLAPAQDSKIGDQLSVTVRDGRPTLSVVTGGKKTVTVKQALSGKILRVENLDGTGLAAGARMRSTLNYDSAKPTLLLVEVGADSKWLIALPGTEATATATGRGSIQEFALALANHYRLVVVVAKDGSDQVTWTFKDDPVASATDALKGTDCAIDRRWTGVIWIQ